MITNPFYVEHPGSESHFADFKTEKVKVVELCKLLLQKHGILLVFDDEIITFCIESETEKGVDFQII